jgi:hypothetical protein
MNYATRQLGAADTPAMTTATTQAISARPCDQTANRVIITRDPKESRSGQGRWPATMHRDSCPDSVYGLSAGTAQPRLGSGTPPLCGTA